MAAMKINLTKLVHAINTNAVRGRSYGKIFLHENFQICGISCFTLL